MHLCMRYRDDSGRTPIALQSCICKQFGDSSVESVCYAYKRMESDTVDVIFGDGAMPIPDRSPHPKSPHLVGWQPLDVRVFENLFELLILLKMLHAVI